MININILYAYILGMCVCNLLIYLFDKKEKFLEMKQ